MVFFGPMPRGLFVWRGEERRVASRTGKVHGCRDSLLTWCGIGYVDLFATYEAGAMLMDPTNLEVDCKSCLRSGLR